MGEQPGLTETLGWVDAWATKPSAYAVAARNAQDIAAPVNFAHENNLRLAVRGGGHSYQGTSNAPDSLLIWTRHMNEITMHDAFVPQGCEHTLQPQPAATLGAGTIDIQAYDAITTKGSCTGQGSRRRKTRTEHGAARTSSHGNSLSSFMESAPTTCSKATVGIGSG